MITLDMYTLLSGSAGITAITSGIWPVVIPQDAGVPALTFQRTTSSRGQNFDEVENLAQTTFQIDSYDTTMNGAITLAEAVKTAINDYTAQISGGDFIHLIKLDSEDELVEPDTKLLRVSQRYIVWHTEA